MYNYREWRTDGALDPRQFFRCRKNYVPTRETECASLTSQRDIALPSGRCNDDDARATVYMFGVQGFGFEPSVWG